VPPVIACLYNLEEGTLGHARAPFLSAGLELDERFLRAGDELPETGSFDGLVVMGGDQSTLDAARLPVLAAEIELIRTVLESGTPYLGVCLGAQLLALAGGGSVSRLEQPVLHWAPLVGVAGDPIFGALPPDAAAVHWHEDGFEPPPGAVEVVRRSGRSGAAFRIGDCAWGVQGHPEARREDLEAWYERWPDAPTRAGTSLPAVRAIDAEELALRQPGVARAIFGGFAEVVREHAAAKPSARTGGAMLTP
jgi:GMP synthase (glutamine-hydrolysing)